MTTSSADDLAGSLQRFGLQRDRMRAALARHAGISATDLDALEHLEADGPLTQKDLGDRLSLTSGAVTMLVDRLERAGWVHRRPHPGDRRYVLIELSPLAAASVPEGLAAYHARVRALAAEVPAAQREAVAAFLAVAADAAAAAAAELSADRRSQPGVSRASRLPAGGCQPDRPYGLAGPAGRTGAAGTSAAPRSRAAARWAHHRDAPTVRPGWHGPAAGSRRRRPRRRSRAGGGSASDH